MSDIVISRAELSDADAVALAESRYIEVPWTKTQVEAEIENDGSCFLVARVDGEFAGYVSGSVAGDEVELSNVAVETRFRRRGVARALFERFIAEVRGVGVRSIFLLVREDNAPAAALYSALGFIAVGNRKNYYGSSNAVIMRLDIK